MRQRRQSILVPNPHASDSELVPLDQPFVVPPELYLTKREDIIRRILVEAAEYIDARPELHGSVPESMKDVPLVLRFTGGWVRDKLLAGQSVDLDVAINKMTGYEFAQGLKIFMDEHGQKFREEYENCDDLDGGTSVKTTGTGDHTFHGGIHKIESNPEKSKHLETATTRLLGLEIDLVNLRSETYTEDSRIPEMVSKVERTVGFILMDLLGIWHPEGRCPSSGCHCECSILQSPYKGN